MTDILLFIAIFVAYAILVKAAYNLGMAHGIESERLRCEIEKRNDDIRRETLINEGIEDEL